MSCVFAFNSNQIPSLEQAGGKGRALMEMTRSGMSVPPGFVLTVDFFTPWLDVLKRAPYLPCWKLLPPVSMGKSPEHFKIYAAS